MGVKDDFLIQGEPFPGIGDWEGFQWAEEIRCTNMAITMYKIMEGTTKVFGESRKQDLVGQSHVYVKTGE